MNHSHEEIQLLKGLMNSFDTGLPCQSSLISNYSRNIIEQKAIQVMVEYCEVKF